MPNTERLVPPRIRDRRGPSVAAQAAVALLVDDFDPRPAAAAAAGIELGPVEIVAGSVRTTRITDPDVDRIQIGQPR